MSKGTLYLLPCPIGDGAVEAVLPAANFEVMRSLDYFVVENARSARRFLSKVRASYDLLSSRSEQGEARDLFPLIDTLEFTELNEHTRAEEIEAMLAPVVAGRDAGVISEAGVPAVADPGAEIVAAAHRKGIRVVPLVGPSSLLLALMASGMNGQSFAFNGYLPVKPPERVRAIKHFERRVLTEHQSQIFIETPYRNGRLFAELLSSLAPETRLCVAVDISAPAVVSSDGSYVSGEFIRTFSVADWRRTPLPPFDKKPTIFIIG